MAVVSPLVVASITMLLMQHTSAGSSSSSAKAAMPRSIMRESSRAMIFFIFPSSCFRGRSTVLGHPCKPPPNLL